MRREQVDARSAPGLAMEVDVDSGCDEDGQPQPGRPSLRKQTVLHTRAEVAKIAAALDHKDSEKSKETSLLSGPDKGEQSPAGAGCICPFSLEHFLCVTT